MVDTILIVVSLASLIIWYVQEKIVRKEIQDSFSRIVKDDQQLTAEQVQLKTSPQWNEWLVKLVFAMWIGWGISVVMLKDGDFALVLVVLTLLSGVVVGLDKWLFARARQAYVASKEVAAYLARYTKEQKDSLVVHLGDDMVVGESARSFFPVLALVLVLRSFVVEPFQIPSASMVPTLLVGDYILVNKFAYGLRLPVLGTKIFDVGEPRRGDVMVFFPPGKDVYYIKRVIGLPGDEITYKNKQLTINGKKIPQTMLAELPPVNPQIELFSEQLGDVSHISHKSLVFYRPGDDFSIKVKPGHYWMMGDNRDNSSDSRVWGQVPEDRIVGKAFAIWMHWPSVTELPSFSRVGFIH